MMLVERHFCRGTAEMSRLCELSRDLYNRCNYLMRKAWFERTYPLPGIVELVNFARPLGCFQSFGNTKTANQTIRAVLSDWSNYRRAVNAYKKTPAKFTKCPKPPGYKDHLTAVTFYSETIRRKPLKSGVITPTNDLFRIRSDRKFVQVVLTPKTFGFIVEVQYEAEKTETPKPKLDHKKVMTVDIGMNNLAAITYDQHRPLLVNGRILKSVNQWYNKRPCKSRSKKRYFRIENYFHHVSRLIVNLCLQNNIGRIVIGRSLGWKTGINLGKRTSQAFVAIPIEKLIQKIAYKAALVGIELVLTEEAYTSKASFFDQDPLPKWERNVQPPVFSGKRKHRGLYVTHDGFAVNADVNGSLNIGRKVIPKFLGIGDRSLTARPVRINPLRKWNGEGSVINPSNQVVNVC